MKLSVVVETGHVALDGEAHTLDLSGVKSDLVDDRTIAIHWNGTDGQIERRSRVAGRVDFEGFNDVTLLAPFMAAFEAHKAQLAAAAAAAVAVAEATRQRQAQELADAELRAKAAMEAQRLKAIG
jgi:hypothetical protein